MNINLTIDQLIQHAIRRQEGVLSNTQALTVSTGARTGRSPKDRFIVKDELTRNTVAWGDINQPFAAADFEKIWQKASSYLANQETFESHLSVGADPNFALKVRVITEKAWHNIFAQHLFIETAPFADTEKTWTILNAPGLKMDPNIDHTNSDGVVIIDLTGHRVLLCGMEYAGEMKKSMFSVLNYFLPEKDVLPMHCSANVGEKGDVALFFGLSGTGKTTLSADPARYLIGDDEHGWSQYGVFNFEGGCYAKCIDLSKEREPVIWNAIRAGAIMENVILNAAGSPDYADCSLTQNTRAAYPLNHIEKRIFENRAGIPQAVIFLTCDLYGVLPPVALLNKQQAAYHFLSGYTALVGSTEVGSAAGIQPTFSTCFGAPFFPRPPAVYAELLLKRIEESGAQVYLINTGWTGGAYGEGGKRFAIPTTRAIVDAALSGELLHGEHETLPGFDLLVPKQIKGVDNKVLNPKLVWPNQEQYIVRLNELIEKFNENFKKFAVSTEVRAAGPKKI